MMDQESIPTFSSEAEEAAWWDAHPEVINERMRQAKAKGGLRRLSETNLPGATEAAMFRLPVDEMKRARQLAAKRGLEYQAYLTLLLHEALDAEEQRLAS